MKTIAFLEPEFERLATIAQAQRLETAAVGIVFNASAEQHRLVVRDFTTVPEDAYLVREPYCLTLAPAFCMELANRARALDCGIILAHTHPTGYARFSATDDAGEKLLADYFDRRAPGRRHFAVVATGSTARCRELGTGNGVDIQVIGSTVRRLATNEDAVVTTGNAAEHLRRFDRQVRAFGVEGQAIVSALRVAIVGLGGTGSIVAQELAHLGVNDFTLIDPDSVDETNLNRLLGAAPSDTGQPKVDIAARSIARINPAARCKRIIGDVVDNDIAPHLLATDFIFSCTDSHASRAVINQVAYQYLVPCIDMGVAIYVHGGAIIHVTGRVQMLAPELPCLICANWLDSNQVRVEMMSPEQRRQDPYFVGHSVTHPAVISLNGTISSAAVTMFLGAVAGFPSEARMLVYDAIRGAMRPTVMRPDANCIVCSQSGALARGNGWDLPTRHEANAR